MRQWRDIDGFHLHASYSDALAWPGLWKLDCSECFGQKTDSGGRSLFWATAYQMVRGAAQGESRIWWNSVRVSWAQVAYGLQAELSSVTASHHFLSFCLSLSFQPRRTNGQHAAPQLSRLSIRTISRDRSHNCVPAAAGCYQCRMDGWRVAERQKELLTHLAQDSFATCVAESPSHACKENKFAKYYY